MKELLEQLGFKDDTDGNTRVYLPMLSEFVKAAIKESNYFVTTSFGSVVLDYTDFITQPLTKGMFIPCDEEGNILEKPSTVGGSDFVTTNIIDNNIKEYQQALERVLFEGDYTPSKKRNYVYDFSNNKIKCINIYKYETIEQAINNGVKLYLK